jgi:hypothetical protein
MDMEVINNELLDAEEVGNGFWCFLGCCALCVAGGGMLAVYGVAANG